MKISKTLAISLLAVVIVVVISTPSVEALQFGYFPPLILTVLWCAQ